MTDQIENAHVLCERDRRAESIYTICECRAIGLKTACVEYLVATKPGYARALSRPVSEREDSP